MKSEENLKENDRSLVVYYSTFHVPKVLTRTNI